MPFLSGLHANHTGGASEEPALRPSRTYVHNRPVFVFLLPDNSTGTGVSSAWSLPSVNTTNLEKVKTPFHYRMLKRAVSVH
ncbi:Uncharacterised protein [Salmonella enterica]|nr:Uncharacterised protein [Salmonella enterica]